MPVPLVIVLPILVLLITVLLVEVEAALPLLRVGEALFVEEATDEETLERAAVKEEAPVEELLELLLLMLLATVAPIELLEVD